MNRLMLRASLLLAATLLLPAVSQAAFRAYLASYGSDSYPCSVNQPCRLLPAALAVVSNGGEVWMLDSANFNSGTVTVTQSVTIQAIPGQVGSIVATGGTPGIIINPGLSVTLRNVAVITNVVAPGTDGIQMTTGSLGIENSVFEIWGSDFATPNGTAIDVNGAATVAIRDSVFRHGMRGIYAHNGAAVDVSNTRFSDFAAAQSYGPIYVEASVASTTTRVAVTHCAIAGAYVAIWADANVANSMVFVTVSGTSVTNSFAGLATQSVSGASATMSISGVTSTNNTYGFYQTGATGILETLSNNAIRNNGGNFGSLTPVSAS